MQTKLTLDEAWRLSLKMWKWIAEWWEEGDWVRDAKDWWLEHNGYVENELFENCFFCEFADKQTERVDELDSVCGACPAGLILKGFSCYAGLGYNYSDQPVAFYNKLVELNEIRTNRN